MTQKKHSFPLLTGLGLSALLGSCRVTPPACAVDEKTGDKYCVGEEEEIGIWTGTGYDFADVFSIATALLSPQNSLICDNFPQVSVNNALSRYEECSNAYESLQTNIPSFALGDTLEVRVAIGSLQVYTGSGRNYTGSSPTIELFDKDNDTFLSSTAYIIEEGCDTDAPVYFRTFVCYYLSGEEPEYQSEDAHLTCDNYMRSLVLTADIDSCSNAWYLTTLSMKMETRRRSSFTESEVINEELIQHYLTSSREIHTLIETLKEAE